MNDDGMMSIGEALQSAFAGIGNVDHVEAADGDFVDSDGYLCCGVCGRRKEYRRQLPFRERLFVVPCLCDCGKAELARQENEMRLKRDRARVEELFSYCLMDDRFRESTFENLKITPENEKAVRIARNYVMHFDDMFRMAKGLILYGSTGTGKTFLAGCIANALMDAGIPVMVTSIIALTRGLGEQLAAVLQKMKSAHLLILDDFGAERDSGFKAEQIFDVIDTRYSTKRPMIITTNYTLAEMKTAENIRQRRVNERILEVCHPIKLDGESWRKKIVRENYKDVAELLEG